MRDPKKYLTISLLANIIQLAILIGGGTYGISVLKDIKEDQKLYNEFMIEQAGLNGAFSQYMEMDSE